MEKLSFTISKEVELDEKISCPYSENYTCDVAVVGCGFAGLNAAVTAKEEGANVLVIDKGMPGYSGLSPWPSSFRWFDKKVDDADAFKKSIMRGGDYIANLHWYENWINESEKIYLRLKDWGILAQYPRAYETGYFYEQEDFVGYREAFDKFDRHKKWVEVLERYEIPYLSHTMVTNVLLSDTKEAAGLLAFHTQSETFITIKAKSVILATGGGSYKPTGYPTGTDTFDGEYMAFEMGLPITGKEFEDFHATSALAPGNVFYDNHWQYLENIWLCGGDVTKENYQKYADNKGRIMAASRVDKAVKGVKRTDGSEIQDVAKADFTRRGASRVYGDNELEVRTGKRSTPVPASLLCGAATGMCCHLTSGVFCGMDDDTGKTAVEGLYVAGDGIHATSPSGAAYPCGVGFTSCFTSIDGDHAGRAAAKYASNISHGKLSESYIEMKKDEITSPLHRENGFDPNWARDVLHSIMAPYWVSTVKSEQTLNAALTQVRYMKANVIPNLAAASGHDIRLCLEMKHKVQSAELKLLASLYRTESRGNTYRSDYPYRDDTNFLCYVIAQKEKTGEIHFEKENIPDGWSGDKTESYEKRYGYYFPGEQEKMGFSAPKEKRNWK